MTPNPFLTPYFQQDESPNPLASLLFTNAKKETWDQPVQAGGEEKNEIKNVQFYMILMLGVWRSDWYIDVYFHMDHLH